MQVDGNEFLRNVNIEREKAKLEKKQQKLEESKIDAVTKEPDYFEPEDEAAYLDIAIDEKKVVEDDLNMLHDIRLENSNNNDDNKKKYIILGLALIVLFIITIVIVRLISNSEEEEKIQKQTPVVKEKTEKIKEDDKLNKIESPKEYKKVLEEEDFQKPTTPAVPKVQKKDIILPEPVKEESPVVIEPKKAAAKPKDLFGLEPVKEKAQEVVKKVQPKKVEAKVKEDIVERKAVQKTQNILPKPTAKIESKPQRKMVVEPPKETSFVKKSTKVEGYYIQIGSFSKKPSDRYLNNVDKKGYSYTIHRMNIKGKYYNKVLIGPYPSRNTAKGSLSKVRKAFNVPGAYILKF